MLKMNLNAGVIFEPLDAKGLKETGTTSEIWVTEPDHYTQLSS